MMSKLVSDLFDISEFAHHGPENLFISLIKIIGSFVFLFLINWKLAIPLLVIVAIMLFFSYGQNKKMQATFMDNRRKIGNLNSSLQEKLKDVLFELEASARSEAFGKDILTQALFQEFMVYLNRIFLEKQYIFDKKSYSYDSQIANILKYINHHLGEDLSVDALASRHYISKYHLMRKFKEETGYTLHNYVINKRLLQARTLISEGTPILKAAHESGFAEYSTFSRAYRKQFGKAPSEEQ